MLWTWSVWRHWPVALSQILIVRSWDPDASFLRASAREGYRPDGVFMALKRLKTPARGAVPYLNGIIIRR
nr:uncharacterized protein CTRU02_14730 [Colletotrichum truncatum]KAF6781853.1 hypothetical protein CTRU02_14730 [Colletotrichum truncatum]